MEIFDGMKTIDGFRAISIESLDAIAIADLHLGYELALAQQGIFVPETQLKEILKDLRGIFKKVRAKDLIIVGDVKHEFGEASAQEWREVFKLIDFLRKEVERIVLVRGNHDNYLLNIISKIGMELHDPYYLAKGIFFVHGHERIKIPKGAKTVVIAHEHPSLVLREGFDKVKVPCLLYGKTVGGKNFICLPAISSWASGTDVNLIPKKEFLSPILREGTDFENLTPIALEKGVGALKFPKIKNLSL
ncbi:MAG: metallophosphoesterase [Candidatus Aenigmarchaeota archaeon]|nr:metallophosphoesterase [Candidatus Aenigmarchaeota archaeon]